MRLEDVARVVEDHQPMIGDAIINDGPGLLLIVEKFPWANTLDVTRGVDEALDALRPGLPDMEIDSTIFRPATYVELSIDKLTNSLFIGCLLLVVVLVLFLFDWRVALISCIAIPLSLIAALLVLDWRGTTINTMILAGFVIALGDIVDDAIIDIENVVRRLRQHRREGSRQSIAHVILLASLEVRDAIVYATLIEVLAMMPVFFLEGLSGAFFKPLAMAYALALLVSMVVALTVTPALASSCFPEHRSLTASRRSFAGCSAYTPGLSGIIRRRRTAYAGVASIALGGIVVLPRLGHELLPSFKERDFLMHWLTKPGTSWPEEKRITIKARKELQPIPGVRNFGCPHRPGPDHGRGLWRVFRRELDQRRSKVDYDKTLRPIQSAVDGYPGMKRDVQTYLKERIREVLTGSPSHHGSHLWPRAARAAR